MFALASTTQYSAMAAEMQCTSRARAAQRMQNCSPRMSAQTMCGMWATAKAAASILLNQTGVLASVSLFVLLILLVNLLIVGLIGVLGFSLVVVSLSCLTGLVISLVGLAKGLSPGTITGD
jgi:hypothetical protein